MIRPIVRIMILVVTLFILVAVSWLTGLHNVANSKMRNIILHIIYVHIMLDERMDGWMDGWVEGWMDVCMSRWVDGWTDGWVGEWMDVWIGK
jgi:hypothetical protein